MKRRNTTDTENALRPLLTRDQEAQLITNILESDECALSRRLLQLHWQSIGHEFDSKH
jgi:hypothetical protein